MPRQVHPLLRLTTHGGARDADVLVDLLHAGEGTAIAGIAAIFRRLDDLSCASVGNARRRGTLC